MKKFTVLFTSLCILFLFSSYVHAEDQSLSISYELGANGSIRSSEGFPIWFTIKNDGNQSFDGQLVVHFQSSTSSRSAKVLPVYVEPGENKTYYTSLPGVGEPTFSNLNEDDIELYEGDWEDGKKVSFKGNKKLTVSIIDYNRSFVGLLSENSDRFKNWRGLTSDNFYWSTLSEGDFPQDADGLEMFDVLIVDEYPISIFETDQIDALIEWIHRGGVLLIGATDQARQTYGEIYEQLPMKFTTEETASNVELTMVDNEIQFDHLHFFSGTVEDGEVISSYGNNPLIIEESIGTGKIIQTAFPLSDHPNVSTNEYATYFSDLLKREVTSSSSTKNILDELYWDLGEWNELFGKMKLSPFQLFIILILYIIFLVPGLYFLLKKMGKQEYAWWIIPTVSLIVSISLFLYGEKDRIKQPLQNELGFFVTEGDQLSGYYLVSFQSNKSGDFQFQTNKAEYEPIPINNPSQFGAVKSVVSYFMENQENVNITYTDVPYRSVYTLAGKVNKSLSHSFAYDLSIHENRLKGSITNLYPFDFEEVFIWSGKDTYPIGPIEQGEEKTVDIELQDPWLTNPTSVTYGYINTDDINDTLKKRLMSNVTKLVYQSENQPMIAGFTLDPVVNMEMVKKNVAKNSLSIISEPFSANMLSLDAFTITDENMGFNILMESGEIPSELKYFKKMESVYGYRDLFLEKGVYDVIFYLPNQLKNLSVTIDELSVQTQMVAGDQYAILNVESGAFHSLAELGNDFLITENANEFISDEGTIIFRLNKTSETNSTIILPKLTVKGRVVDD